MENSGSRRGKKSARGAIVTVALWHGLFFIYDDYWAYAYASVVAGLWLATFVYQCSHALWPVTFVAIIATLTGSHLVVWMGLVVMTVYSIVTMA